MEDNKAIEYYSKFDDFMHKRMDSEERLQLQNELSKDPDLQREYDLFRLSVDGINRSGIKAEVMEASKRFTNERGGKGKSINLTTWTARIAAGLIIVAVSTALFYLNSVKRTDLYESLYVEYKLPVTRASEDTPTRMDSLYVNGSYELAMAYYNTLVDKSPRDYFLGGMIFLRLGSHQEAINVFTTLQENNTIIGTNYFSEEIDYYLALSNLRNGNYDEAIKLFEKIKADPSHLYHANVSSKDIFDLKLLDWKD